MTTAKLAFDQVRSFLDDERMRYDDREEELVIRTGYRLEVGNFPVLISVSDEPAVLGIHVQMPLVVPEPQRSQAAEAIARANHGLMLGRFDLNLSDGDLVFRSGMPLAETGVAKEQFDALSAASLWSVERYHRAFGRLLYGDDLSPAEVIAEVEMADG